MNDPSAQTEHNPTNNDAAEEMHEAAAAERDEEREAASISSETAPLASQPDPLQETTPLMGKSKSDLKGQEPRMWVAKCCHVGAIRERNEDSCLTFISDTGGHFSLLPFGLYIVADGMGGHQNGHVASNIASRIAARRVINKIYLPLLEEEGNPSQTPIQEVLIDAVEAANRAIFDPDPEKDAGTTLTIALVLGRRLYVAHVGDTRIYLQQDDKLEIITTDHSLVKHMQEVGDLADDDESLYNIRHVLLRAVGQGDELEIDTYTHRLPQKGRLLLCTDGLSGLVTDERIETIMQQNDGVQDTVDQLFQAAMDAGGYDNITAVVVDFHL